MKPRRIVKKGMQKWIDEERALSKHYDCFDDDAFALDITNCPVTVSYLRQHFRSNGYATCRGGKNSRWLFVHKRERG